MDNEVLVNRIYSVQVTGVDASLQGITNLNNAILATDEAFQQVKAALQQKIDAGGTATEVAKLTTEAKKLSDQLATLISQQQMSSKEALLLAKAETEVAKTEAIKTKVLIDQAKETDRQLDRAAKLAKASEKQRIANEAEADSYIAIRNQMAELKPFIEGRGKGTGETLTFNGSEINYTQAISEFKRLSLAEADFRRQFASDGTLVGEYSSGIIQAFSKLGLNDIIKKQGNDINNQLKKLQEESRELAQQLKQAGASGSESFNMIDKSLRENISHQESLKNSLHNIEAAYAQTGGIGQQVTQGISESFKNIKAQLSQMIVGYLGFQAAISGVQSIIHQNEELSDSLAQLRIYIHGTKEEAGELFEQLKKIDTRTSLNGLVDIATSVAQKGVAKDQIAGVTKAFDELFTALGKDGGNVHEGVMNIAKLISIFHEDHEVTAERVKELGNAMFALQSSGPVKGEYLQGFAERVGAVRSITGATIPQILGMGAAYQQLGQSEEVAGSASSILLTKMIANEGKFAAIAGVSVDAFKKVVKENPFEALLMAAEKLKLKGDEGVDVLVKMVGDLGVNNVRARGAFSELINNAVLFRSKMELAGTSINDTSGLLSAFNEKQETFAATIDKIGKAFTNATSNKSFIDFLNLASSAILYLVQVVLAIPFSFVIGGLSLWAAGWAYTKGQVVSTTLAQLASNTQTALGATIQAAARLGLLNKAAAEAANTAAINEGNIATTKRIASLEAEIVTEKAIIASIESKVAATEQEAVANQSVIATSRAKIVALEAQIAVTEEATVATETLNAVSTFSPLGIILAGLALLIPAMGLFGMETSNATHKLKEFKNTQEIDNEILKKSTDTIVQQTSKIDLLVNVLKDAKVSIDTKKDAMLDLIKIDKSFDGVIENNKVNLEKLATAYDKVTDSIKLKAEAEAADTIEQQAKSEYDKIVITRKKIEADLANNHNSIVLSDKNGYNENERDIADEDEERLRDPNGNIEINGITYDRDKYFKALEAREKAAHDKYQNIYDLNQKKYKGTGDKPITDASGNPISVFEQFKALVKSGGRDIDWENLKNEIEKQKGQFITTSNEYQNLENLRDQIDNYLNPKKKNKTERGPFDKIDAKRDTDLATEEEGMLKKKQSNQLDLTAEADYYIKIRNINLEALNSKIDILNKKKSLDDKELLQLAQFRKEKVDLEIRANEQIEAAKKKEYDKESKQTTKDYTTSKRIATDNYNEIADNPNASATQKAKAKIDLDNQLIILEQAYNERMNTLEYIYGQKSVENEEARAENIKKLRQELNKDTYAAYNSNIADIDKAYDKDVSRIKALYAGYKKKLFDDNSTSDEDKKNKGADLDSNQENNLLAAASAHAFLVLDQIKKDFAAGKATQQQLDDAFTNYAKAVEDYKNKTKQSGKNLFQDIGNTADLLKQKLSGAFGFTIQDGDDSATVAKKAAQQKTLGDTINQSYQTASNAMNFYFDEERIRIENSLKLAERQIDASKRVALGHAQSAAEADTIERRAEAQKIAAQKTAFEQNKKLQKAQAEINLGIQLSNIGAVAFSPSNPLNLISGGAWGAVFYAVQAALAVANYAMDVQKINSAQFATGGKIMPMENGKITTPSNIPTRPNGDNILATVKTGEVILNETQQKALGGDSTFAAIGVPGFSGGGFTGWKPLGNQNLGSILKAPINPASFLLGSAYVSNSNTSSSKDMDDLKAMIAETNRQVAETAQHVANIKVHVVSKDITGQQRKDRIQSSIGRLG